MGKKLGYARVSTDKQALTHSLEYQMSRLLDAGVDEVRHDVESGGEITRKEFDIVLESVRAREVDHIIATKWDRVTRNLELYLEIKKLVDEYGVVLEFLDGGEADLKTAAGKLHALIQVAFSVHERDKIIERVNDGFDGRRKRNAAWGSQPWGYIAVNDKYQQDRRVCRYRVPETIAANFSNVEDDHSDAGYKFVFISKIEVTKDAFNYFIEHRTITKLMRYMADKYQLKKGQETPFTEMKDFPLSRAGLKRWLTNPVFQGHTAYHKFYKNGTAKPSEEFDIRLNTHPEERLISDEEANEIKSILEDSSKAFGNPRSRFYLSGLIFCDNCGGRCNLKSGGGYSYYGCRYASSICDSGRATNLVKIEKSIIRKIVTSAQKISQEGAEHLDSPEILEIQNQIKQTQSIDGFEFSESLKRAIKDLKKREKIILESKNNEHSLLIRMLQLSEARKINFWYTLSEDERAIFYKRLVSRVSVLDGEVKSVILKISEI